MRCWIDDMPLWRSTSCDTAAIRRLRLLRAMDNAGELLAHVIVKSRAMRARSASCAVMSDPARC